jgi:hypothetical protein
VEAEGSEEGKTTKKIVSARKASSLRELSYCTKMSDLVDGAASGVNAFTRL